MLTKVVIVFLGVMVIIGMIGSTFYKRLRGGDSSAKNRAVFCGTCGRPLVGRGPCGCKG
jgi:hypothetical protein